MRKAMLAFLMSLTVLLGCSSDSPALPPREMKTLGTGTSTLNIPPPKVEISGNLMIISGVVQRRPGYAGPTPGHLHLSIVSKDGFELYNLTAKWDPADIPTDGERQSPYRLQFGWVPPKGATIQPVWSNDTHDMLEGGGAAGTGDNAVMGTRGTPSKPSTPKQPSATPRQPSQGTRSR